MSVPKLYFKEFGGDWEAEKLSQVANLTSSKRVHLCDYVSEGIPFFRGKEITELKSGIFPKDILYISKKQYEDFKEKFGVPQNNEILMTAVGTLANTYLINTDFEFYFKDGNLIWFKDINADPKFLMILLDARKNDVLASAIGSTQKALTIANLNKLIFNFPLKDEQTKIASFLSSVDEKISQLTQKHALLSQYKQGIMQKLFSQKIRFKADNGGEFGRWVEIKITDVADYVDYRGKTPKKVEDGILLVTAKNIRFGYIDYSISQEYICLDDFDEVMRRGRAEIGDVLITTEAPLGNVASVDRENIALAQRVIKYRGKKGILNNEFLKQKFLSEEFQSLISSKATGGTVQGIKGSTLHNLEIHIPEDIEEQTKIANFLSSIDQKIEIVAKQVEQTKQWKKGLLQQMFV